MKENIQLNNNEISARARIEALELEFQKLSEAGMSDAEFYIARGPIDNELSKIYDKFPHLKDD